MQIQEKLLTTLRDRMTRTHYTKEFVLWKMTRVRSASQLLPLLTVDRTLAHTLGQGQQIGRKVSDL